jgi:tRNA pseudouridine38-40 synthase
VLRIRLTVAYDGRGFHGFAANAGVRTVAGELVAALTRVLRLDAPVELTCAGRTDRGVHAVGQVVTFDVPADRDLSEVVERINALVEPEVAVRDVEVVAADFDARHSATSRTYRYVVWNRPEPDPFRAGLAWHVPEPLDIELLRLACDPFIGLHEFGAFCRRATQRDGTPVSLVRRVQHAAWHETSAGVLQFEITASSFCHQMVRSVVGTMVEVGLGKRRAGDLLGVIRSGDRSRAGQLAPPDGLYLLSVGYDAA